MGIKFVGSDPYNINLSYNKELHIVTGDMLPLAFEYLIHIKWIAIWVKVILHFFYIQGEKSFIYYIGALIDHVWWVNAIFRGCSIHT